LTTPIDIVVGGRSIVCNDITQIIEVRGEETKFRRLVELLREWYDKGNVLVFANTQESTDLVFTQLTQAGYPCLSLHGGKDQLDRDFTIQEFKAKEKTLMVATSIAARGLDVKDLKLVVNFDVPNHYEDYIHRVGRTGRAGNKGTAVTFITPDEERFAPDLMKALTASKSPVPPELQALTEGLQKKKTEGQSVQTHGSGFGGKGFKFDETEEAKRQEQLKAQKKSWGVEEEEEESHAIEKVEGEGTTSTSQTTSSTSTPASSGPPTTIAGVTLPPGLAALNPVLLTQLANAITALHNTGGEGATATAKETAQQFINQMIVEVQKMPASTPPAQKAQFVGTILSIQSGMMKTPAGKLHFDAELEINDFSQQARWKVTHKDALSNITEWTGAAITTRGLFFGPGVKVPPGERKLYLYIEGSSEHSVQTAKKEIKRILDEASLAGPGQERGPVGRYQVL
jgi:ATP-dependent RNA helicase DDX46/PRP5